MLIARYQQFSHLARPRSALSCSIIRTYCQQPPETLQPYQWINYRKHRSTLNPSYFMIGTLRQFPQSYDRPEFHGQSKSVIERYLTEDVIAGFSVKTFDQVWHMSACELRISSGDGTPLSPGDIAHTWVNLLQVKYADLTRIPWIERVIPTAYMQLQIAGSLEEEMTPLWQTPEMNLLCRQTQALFKKCTHQELVDMCLAMVFLGMEKTDHLLHDVVYECVERVPSLEPEQLYILSEACRRISKRSTVVSSIIVRCQEILTDQTTELTGEMAAALCLSLINCRQLCSTDVWETASDKIMKLLEDDNTDISIDSLTDLIRFGQKSLYGIFFNKPLSNRILNNIAARSVKKIDDSHASHIGIITSVLSASPDFSKQQRNIFQARAIELISETTKLSDTVNLLFAISPVAPLPVRRHVDSKLFVQLTDADCVILSNLSRILLNPQARNPDIMYRFHYLTIQRIEELFHDSFAFARVLRLLCTYPHADRTLQVGLVKALEDLIEKTDIQFFDHLVISYIARYVFPLSQHSLNTKLLLGVIHGIPRWSMNTILQLMLGLNRLSRRECGTVMQNQVARIYQTLHKRVLEKSDITHSMELYYLCLGLVKNRSYRDPMLTSKFLDMYSIFTPHLGIDLMPVVQLFRTVRYHHPAVYDDFVSHVIDNPPDPRKASHVLSACAFIGYIPSRVDEFTAVLLSFFKDDIQNPATLRLVTTTLTNLAQIQQFPEDELSRVFSVEFIEQIDSLLGTLTFKYRSLTERRMMSLNRAVCLECPQLGVPWFHDEYCINTVVTDEHTADGGPAKKRIRDDVEACLLEVLGGDRYMRRWSYSPYYHEIDFECLLDRSNRPVIMGRKTKKDVSDHQRVAILTQTEENFCYNSKLLNGTSQTQVRHLEILLYKVVQIPHFDWYSMGLTDWQAKKDYLSKKIFSSQCFT